MIIVIISIYDQTLQIYYYLKVLHIIATSDTARTMTNPPSMLTRSWQGKPVSVPEPAVTPSTKTTLFLNDTSTLKSTEQTTLLSLFGIGVVCYLWLNTVYGDACRVFTIFLIPSDYIMLTSTWLQRKQNLRTFTYRINRAIESLLFLESLSDR